MGVNDSVIHEFVEAIKQEPSERTTTASAIVARTDEEGVVWVYLAGSKQETPTASTSAEVEAGDVVTVEWRNNKLYIVGNSTNPSAGLNTVRPSVKYVESLVEKNVTADSITATTGYIDDLTSKNITTDNISASTGYIKQLMANSIEADDIIADHAEIGSLDANYAHITNGVIDNAKIGYADVNELDANYAEIDIANVNNAWIENGAIKKASVFDENVFDLSGDHATLSRIDASKINVANLRADNLVVRRINGQPVVGGYTLIDSNSPGYSSKNPKALGWYEFVNAEWVLSTDTTVDETKAYYQKGNETSLYDQAYIDALADNLEQQIDGAIETFTGSVVPTLVNYPYTDWYDTSVTPVKDERAKHIGDIYFVVNTASDQNGYCYRFAFDNTTSSYMWVLIKDSDVTKALADITDLQAFESSTTSWIDETDQGLVTIRTNHTNLEGVVNKTVKESIQLWFTKANTTAPKKPTTEVTSTSTAGNDWRKVVPAYNASYPNYYYCWQYKFADGTFGWSDVVRDIAMGETQGTARDAKNTADNALPASTFTAFESTTFAELVDEVDEQSSTITNMTTRLGMNADGTGASTDIVAKESALEQTVDGINTRVGKAETKLTGMYATSTTAAGTAAKVGTIIPTVTGTWELTKGTTVTVKFTQANTAASPTLNINGTGAKAIKNYSNGNLTEAEYKWKAGDTFTFTYNGTNWLMQDSTASVRMSNAETRITQNADAIALKASQSDMDSLTGRMSTAESTLTVQAGQIASKVETTDYTGAKVASLINQSADSVKIQANHVEIDGTATFNAIKSQTDAAYDSKGAAQSAVDELSMGGRNILRGTANPQAKNPGYWYNVGWYRSGDANIEWGVDLPETPIAELTKGVKITWNSSVSQCGPAQGNIPLNKGEVTLSAWVKASAGDKVRLQTHWAAADSAKPEIGKNKIFNIEDDGWYLYSFTTTVDYYHPAVETQTTTNGYACGGYVYIIPKATSSVAYICGIKLEAGNKATAWTPAPEDVDDAINDVANNSVTKANAIKRTQRIYYQSNSTSPPDTPGIVSSYWVTDNTGAANTWTKKRMSYASATPYIWTCEQSENAAGTVSYTTVLLDDTTTVIDGGKIITGSVTANQIAANAITAEKIAANAINASKISIRDYNNYVTVNENDANSLVGIGQSNNANITDGWLYKINATTSNVWVSPCLARWATPGEQYRVTCKVKMPSAGRFCVNLYSRDANNASLGFDNTKIYTIAANTETEINDIITVMDKSGTVKNNIAVTFLPPDGTSGYSIGYWKELKVERMSGGSLIVDGAITADKIDAHSINAQHLSISDTSNLAIINELYPESLNGDALGASKLVLENGWIKKSSATNSYMHFTPSRMPLGFKQNDELYYEFYIKGDVAENTNVKFGVWCYDSSNTVVGSNKVSIPVTTSEAKVYGTIKLTHSGFGNAISYIIGIGDERSTKSQLYVKKIIVRRKNGGELIVDGAIQANNLTIGLQETIKNGDNMLVDWDAPSLTKVNAPVNRYWSDDANKTYITCSIEPITNPPDTSIKYMQRFVGNGTNTSSVSRTYAFYATNESTHFTAIPFKAGVTYTLSFWARASDLEVGIANLYVAGSVSDARSEDLSLTKEWKKYYKTFHFNTLPTNYYRCWPGVTFLANKAGTLEICGASLVPEWDSTDASKRATTYITDIDSNKGITIKPSDKTGNNYLQINSNSIDFFKSNKSVVGLTDSAFRMGLDDSGHSTTKSDGLHIWTGVESTPANEVAFFGATARIGTESGRRLALESDGIRLYNSSNKQRFGLTDEILCLGNPSGARVTIKSATNDTYIFMGDANDKQLFKITSDAATIGRYDSAHINITGDSAANPGSAGIDLYRNGTSLYGSVFANTIGGNWGLCLAGPSGWSGPSITIEDEDMTIWANHLLLDAEDPIVIGRPCYIGTTDSVLITVSSTPRYGMYIDTYSKWIICADYNADSNGIAMIPLAGERTGTTGNPLYVTSGGYLRRNTSSSKRYKKDISIISDEELNPDRLYNVEVKQFVYRDDYLDIEDQRYGKVIPGFIVEELENIYPIAVTYENEEPENWDSRYLIPPMLKLIQNQKNEIDRLTERLDAFERRA